MDETSKLLRVVRQLILLGVYGYAALWALGFIWLAFNH